MDDKNVSYESLGPLYDYQVKCDTQKLPEELQIMITQLEEFDKENDWFNYDLLFDELEIAGKGYLRRNEITEEDYKKILRKYGWYND